MAEKKGNKENMRAMRVTGLLRGVNVWRVNQAKNELSVVDLWGPGKKGKFGISDY